MPTNAELIEERDRLMQRVSAAEMKLARFQEQVRDVAIRVAAEQDWCNSGLNEVLNELGLAPKVEKYTARIIATFDVEIETGTEPDQYDLMRWAEDHVELSPYGHDYDDFDIVDTNVEVEDVEPVSD